MRGDERPSGWVEKLAGCSTNRGWRVNGLGGLISFLWVLVGNSDLVYSCASCAGGVPFTQVLSDARCGAPCCKNQALSGLGVGSCIRDGQSQSSLFFQSCRSMMIYGSHPLS